MNNNDVLYFDHEMLFVICDNLYAYKKMTKILFKGEHLWLMLFIKIN